MRYSKEHKEQTRERILEAAGRVFRRGGYSASGVDAVMADAGLTAGAFYRHFDSKEDLLGEVMSVALDHHAPQREQGLGDLEGRAWVEGLVGNYLSEGHFDAVEDGCPLPSLVPELRRAGEPVRHVFGAGVERWRGQLSARLGELQESERVALADGLISAMVGGMTVARALPTREEALRHLDATHRAALRLIEGAWLHSEQSS